MHIFDAQVALSSERVLAARLQSQLAAELARSRSALDVQVQARQEEAQARTAMEGVKQVGARG